MLNNMTLREKILLIIVFFSLFICLYYNYFLSPKLKEIAEIRTRIENIGNEKININKNNPNNDIIELKSLPDMEKNYEIAYNIKMIADDSSVDFLGIKFGEPVKCKKGLEGNEGNDYNKLFTASVNVLVVGERSNLFNFIDNIEKNLRINELQNVNIIGSNNGRLSASIQLDYYFLNNTAVY